MDSRIRIAITRSPARVDVVRIVVVIVIIIPRLDDDQINRTDERDRTTTATNTHDDDDAHDDTHSSRGVPSRVSCVTGHDRRMEGLHTHAGVELVQSI
jgi:hypothetical protein